MKFWKVYVVGGVEGSFSHFFYFFLCCLKGQTKLCRKKNCFGNINTYSLRQIKIKIGVGWVKEKKKKTNEYINDVEKITIYNI